MHGTMIVLHTVGPRLHTADLLISSEVLPAYCSWVADTLRIVDSLKLRQLLATFVD
jgi:hypothetical protein